MSKHLVPGYHEQQSMVRTINNVDCELGGDKSSSDGIVMKLSFLSAARSHSAALRLSFEGGV